MGQCWSRPRRQTKVCPLGIEMNEIRRGSDEVTENESSQSSSKPVVVVNGEKVERPRKLAPLPGKTRRKNAYMYSYMERETQNWERNQREAAWQEKEIVEATSTNTVNETPPRSMQEKQSRKNKVSPYWKLQDVPLKPACLTNAEDVKNGMKCIDSEMNALLKPEEKYRNRSVTFTIGKPEAGRPQTPGHVPPRLLKHQKAKVDRVNILEKQREAERRRNANIAKRVQSAKHRSAPKKPTVEEIEQEKKTLEALKSQVSDKMESAHARRSDVMKKRVKTAKKSGSLRKEPEDPDESIYKNKVKVKVDFKMKGAADRRNEILGQKAHAAKKEGRTELVNEIDKEFADVHKSKLEVRLSKIKENRERMLRRKLRSLQFQERKRELARKALARQTQENEERSQTFIETETYDGDDDLGEHDWD